MANPQKENGYTIICHEIMEALAKTRIPGEARQVLDVVFRETYGWNRKEAKIDLSSFCLRTGLRKSTVCKALSRLRSMELITQKGNAKDVTYGIQKNFERWKPLPKKEKFKFVTQKGNDNYPKRKKSLPKKETKLVDSPCNNEHLDSAKEIVKKERNSAPENPALIALFDSFYREYPKHQGRKKALQAFIKINPQNGQFESILSALKKQKAYRQHQEKQNPKPFIPEWPLPATWLNGERWTDELPDMPKGKWD